MSTKTEQSFEIRSVSHLSFCPFPPPQFLHTPLGGTAYSSNTSDVLKETKSDSLHPLLSHQPSGPLTSLSIELFLRDTGSECSHSLESLRSAT